MAKLRIEFTRVGGARGRLGAQVNARPGRPIGTVTLEVGAAPTAVELRPVVPAETGTLFAELTAADAAIYVDVSETPDPATEPRLLLLPGRVQLVHVLAGQTLSAMLAAEIGAATPASPVGPTDRSGTLTAAGTAQQACAAKPDRRLLVVSNPDETRTFWFNTTGTATTGAGSHAVPPTAAYVFDRLVPSGAVSVIGPAASQPFTVKEA